MNREALIFFILGLIFGIPISVLGNLLTPSFRSWYLGRSRTKINKRLDKIAQELARIDALTPNDLHDTIIQSVVLLLIMVFQLNVVVVVLVISRSKIAFLFEFLNRDQFPWLLLLTLFFIVIMLSLKKMLFELKLHTKFSRHDLLKEKTNLETRLTQAGSP
jgi:hypothetical protein